MSSTTPSVMWLQALRQYSALYSRPSAPVPSHLPLDNLIRPTTKNRSNNTPNLSASPLSSSSNKPFPSLSEQLSLYETVARAHLFGPQGFQIHPDSLSVLRQVRWNLMKHNPRREKTILMKKILELFTEATQSYLYDPTRSTAAEQQSLALEQIQCLVEAKISGISLSSHHLRHPLQCTPIAKIDKDLPLLLLREAEVVQREQKTPSYITLGGMDGRHAHKTSITSFKLRNRMEEKDHQNSRLVIMRLYCAIGLAGACHPAEALRMCQMADDNEGRGFAFVANRVRQLSKDGAERAWEMADSVPLSVLFKSTRTALAEEMQLSTCEVAKHVKSGSLTINHGDNYGNSRLSLEGNVSLGKDKDIDLDIGQQISCEEVEKRSKPRWLEGLLEVVLHKHRETRRNSASMKNWLLSFMKLFEEELEKSTKGTVISYYHVNENESKIHSNKTENYLNRSPLRHPEHIPRCIVETYLSVCPSAAWREAYFLVLHYNQAVSAQARELSISLHNSRRIPIGRLMRLLRLVGRPLEVLQLFYNTENLLIQQLHNPKEETDIKDLKGLMTIDGKVNVEICLSEKVQAHLTFPRGTHLSEEDKRQPIIYNHVIMALGEIGLWPQAMRFYKELSPNLKNIFTDWSMAKGLLLVRSDRMSVNSSEDPLLDEETYRVGVSCVHHALDIPNAAKYSCMLPSVMKNLGAWDGASRRRGISVAARDRVNVLESLALWAAVLGDWKEACTLADYAPSTCRYVRLIAIASTLREFQFTQSVSIKKDLSEALHNQYLSLCNSPNRSIKQICLALAMLVCSNITTEVTQDNKIVNNSDHAYHIIDTVSLESATIRSLNEQVCHSKPVMNKLIMILMDYIRSIQTHQIEKSKKSTDAPLRATFFGSDFDNARSCTGSISLLRSNILNSIISLVQCYHFTEVGRNSINLQNDLLVNVLRQLSEANDFSIAHVAPAMISAGCTPEFTLRLLT
ncbi:unnamed protein product [Phytomonas sp. Hart1]|nr:unnamed protein product [Phytomonas sp. Hart1]|eukprot:CCW69054.1 unnamed protein product [Phytomonas sp. isolate Hart1]